MGLALDSLPVSTYVCPSHYTVAPFRFQIVHRPWSNTLLLFGTRTAALSSGSSPPGPSKGKSPMWAFRPFFKFFARFWILKWGLVPKHCLVDGLLHKGAASTHCLAKLVWFPLFGGIFQKQTHFLVGVPFAFKLLYICFLKGQSNEIFYLQFFHWWTPLKPLTRFLKTFRVWLGIRWDIHDFLLSLRCNL